MPADVYLLALSNQPLQQANAYRLQAAQKSKAAARGAMYPTIAAFGNISTNYLAFSKQPFYDRVFSGYVPSAEGLKTNVNGTFYDVQSPAFTQGNLLGYIKPPTLGSQFADNRRQSVGLSLSVPIFNSGSLKANYERSKLNIETLEYQKTQDDLQLKQDIYQAHNAAVIALEKFNASKKSVASSEKTFEFANKRFAVGMLNSFDLITTQNNLLRAKLEYTINQFDYVFKMKVLEFYRGQGLKL
jgi:outer membrane protein